MKALYREAGTLDKRCYEAFSLSEDLLMENAAIGLKHELFFKKFERVLIVSGPGNNGADGIALARMIFGLCDVDVLLPLSAKSPMCKLQLERAQKIGLEPVDSFDISKSYDVIVDALFGTGLTKELSSDLVELIQKLNLHKAYKIACDIPSGLSDKGLAMPIAFEADITVTMGAYKTALFSRDAKTYTGKIKIAHLGISENIYCLNTDMFVLEEKDMRLPLRKDVDTHKGKYGHCAIVLGEKEGAATLSALVAFCFGAGLVTLVTKESKTIPMHLMQSQKLPCNTTAIACGMGLGDKNLEIVDTINTMQIPVVLDADIFYTQKLCAFLQRDDVVLTPHPKEFSSLLKLVGLGEYSVDTVQADRFLFVQKFHEAFPKPTLLFKGTYTIVASKGDYFVNPFSSPALSQGGSGDILSGLIVSLLAQGYCPKDASITASLALVKAASMIDKNNYSITPEDIIEQLGRL